MQENPLFIGETVVSNRRPIPDIDGHRDKASSFCDIMRHSKAPERFNLTVLNRLIAWGLIDPDTDPGIAQNYKEFRELTHKATHNALDESFNFEEHFSNQPWDYDESIEGEYRSDELDLKFPLAHKIKTSLQDEQLKFVFRAEPGEYYLNLVVREDGRRQVVRAFNTKRSAAEINNEALSAPKVLPNFEAVDLQEGKILFLIDWIDGHHPETDNEKNLCIEQARSLLDIPLKGYDLWAINFVVTNHIDPETNQPFVYYVDRDVFETIACVGYSPETKESRIDMFSNGAKLLV